MKNVQSGRSLCIYDAIRVQTRRFAFPPSLEWEKSFWLISLIRIKILLCVKKQTYLARNFEIGFASQILVKP